MVMLAERLSVALIVFPWMSLDCAVNLKIRFALIVFPEMDTVEVAVAPGAIPLAKTNVATTESLMAGSASISVLISCTPGFAKVTVNWKLFVIDRVISPFSNTT